MTQLKTRARKEPRDRAHAHVQKNMRTRKVASHKHGGSNTPTSCHTHMYTLHTKSTTHMHSPHTHIPAYTHTIHTHTHKHSHTQKTILSPLSFTKICRIKQTNSHLVSLSYTHTDVPPCISGSVRGGSSAQQPPPPPGAGGAAAAAADPPAPSNSGKYMSSQSQRRVAESQLDFRPRPHSRRER